MLEHPRKFTSFDLETSLSKALPTKKYTYITIRTTSGASLQANIYPWTTIDDLKIDVQRRWRQWDGEPQVHLENLKLFWKNVQMNGRTNTLQDYGVISGAVVMMRVSREKNLCQISPMINAYKLFDRGDENVQRILDETMNAVQNGKCPQLTPEGTSGVYFIENLQKKRISIFKPYDQEVNAPNNPRNRQGNLGSDSIVRGILSGQCATREVAAYLLDSNTHIHSIPVTTYIQFYHPAFQHTKHQLKCKPIPSCQEKGSCLEEKITKHGSLQEFVKSEGMIGDWGKGKFDVEEVQKIAMLDLRIINCDRNEQNILVQKDNRNFKLIPIDHGLSFPDNFQVYEQSMIWMSFPQVNQPLTPKIVQFISNIDPKKDVELLREKLGFREICLRNFRVAQIFLKKAVEYGLTFYQMGKIFYRSEDEDLQLYNSSKNRSELERLILQAQNLYLNIKEEKRESTDSQQLDSTLEENAPTTEKLQQATAEMKKSAKLKLIKKISLPVLKKKTTSYHEYKYKTRKQKEGINGISKTVWGKYHQEKWDELFYHYVESLLETYLQERYPK